MISKLGSLTRGGQTCRKVPCSTEYLCSSLRSDTKIPSSSIFAENAALWFVTVGGQRSPWTTCDSDLCRLRSTFSHKTATALTKMHKNIKIPIATREPVYPTTCAEYPTARTCDSVLPHTVPSNSDLDVTRNGEHPRPCRCVPYAHAAAALEGRGNPDEVHGFG
jgi:hypothetical protein